MFTNAGILFILTVFAAFSVNDATKRADVRGFFTEDNSLKLFENKAGLSTISAERKFGAPRVGKAKTLFRERDSCVNKIQYLSAWKPLPNSSYKTKTRAMLTLELGP